MVKFGEMANFGIRNSTRTLKIINISSIHEKMLSKKLKGMTNTSCCIMLLAQIWDCDLYLYGVTTFYVCFHLLLNLFKGT